MAKPVKKKKSNSNKVFKSENITIDFRPYESGNTLGFCKVTFYECITVYNCTIIDSKNGPFISMPSYKGKDDNYYNYVYIDKDDDLMKELDDLVKESMEVPFE